MQMQLAGQPALRLDRLRFVSADGAIDLKISSKEVGGEPTTDLSVSDKGGASPRSPWSPSRPPSQEGQSPAAAKQTPSKPGLGS